MHACGARQLISQLEQARTSACSLRVGGWVCVIIFQFPMTTSEVCSCPLYGKQARKCKNALEPEALVVCRDIIRIIRVYSCTADVLSLG